MIKLSVIGKIAPCNIKIPEKGIKSAFDIFFGFFIDFSVFFLNLYLNWGLCTNNEKRGEGKQFFPWTSFHSFKLIGI
jgi:hypothetical protein